MKPRRTLINLLIVLLLFTQQAAYAHAVTHLGKEPPAREQLAHSKLCDRCVSFEKISGVAPVSAPLVLALEASFTRAPEVTYRFSPPTVVAFQGRAPPTSL